ncbi:MAG: ATP-binding protein involved in chromosome partitioning, partial [Actinomycetota bacterium]|nr:ATP-binding protein involved in chromosome partitioning [Actinomycetota bacterium]
KQRVIGVVENMSSMACPHCGEPIDLFGSGGGSLVAQVLSQELDTDVRVLERVPFDVRLRTGGDEGTPLVLAEPDAPATQAIMALADHLSARPRGLAGLSLGLTPASRF